MALFSDGPVGGYGGVATDVDLGLSGDENSAVGFDPRAALRLHQYLSEHAPAIVVAHGGDSLKYAVAALGRARIVYVAIGTVAASVNGFARGLLWRTLVRRAELVAAVSKDVADECHGLLRVPTQKIRVVPNGRDAARFTPALTTSGAKRGGPPTLIFVGRLTQGKRPDRFIELVKALKERGQDLRAMIVGDGPMRAELEPLALGAGVDLLGGRDDVSELMRDADLFVFTSLPEGEGMPGVLIEAGLSGLPVVATAVPGVSDVVEQGVTGVIVGVSDFQSLVDESAELLADYERRTMMANAARARCVKSFSMEASAAQFRDLLGEVQGAGRRAHGGAARC
jgi:glycosyltransferase involved in cell wall biosynthesis